MARLNSARSRVRSVICRRTGMAQMSLSFSGAFCPTSFSLLLRAPTPQRASIIKVELDRRLTFAGIPRARPFGIRELSSAANELYCTFADGVFGTTIGHGFDLALVAVERLIAILMGPRG